MNKILTIFKGGLLLKASSFKRFDWPLRTYILYFLLLNLVMFIPLSFTIYELDESIQGLLGVQVTDTLALKDLDPSCEIVNQTFICEKDEIDDLIIEINDVPFIISFFKPLEQNVNGISFNETTAEMIILDNSLNLDYRGFSYTPFVDFETMESNQIYDVLFEGFYPSVRPYIALPLILVFVGGYIITNIILLFTLSALTMLFKLTISDFPNFKNTLKLFIVASTIPAIINFGIGFFGLSAFSSLVYNFLTPLFVYILYRRYTLEEDLKRKP